MSETPEIFKYMQGLEQLHGIWYSPKTIPVSFPHEGQADCYEIEDGSFWFRHRNRCILHAVKKYSRANSAFFDLGGGNGYVARALAEEGFSAYLVEHGEIGAQNARARGIKNVICSAIENVRFLKNSLPSIGLFDVLEHIEDDRSLLEQLSSSLAENGRIYITVPAYQQLWSPVDVHSGHFRRYSLPTLTKMIEQAGYCVDYSSYFFSYLFFPVLLFRTVPGKLGGRLSGSSLTKESLNNALSPRRKMVERIWSVFESGELKKLEKGRTIPFGTSCLIVARKK